MLEVSLFSIGGSPRAYVHAVTCRAFSPAQKLAAIAVAGHYLSAPKTLPPDPMNSLQRIFIIGLTICGMISVSAFAQQNQAKSPLKDVAAAPNTAQLPLPTPSASARDLFSRYKDRLVQVRVLLNSANEQSSLGSGFLVRDDGAKGAWLLTNYHVVSSLAINPEKFRLELRQIGRAHV